MQVMPWSGIVQSPPNQACVFYNYLLSDNSFFMMAPRSGMHRTRALPDQLRFSQGQKDARSKGRLQLPHMTWRKNPRNLVSPQPKQKGCGNLRPRQRGCTARSSTPRACSSAAFSRGRRGLVDECGLRSCIVKQWPAAREQFREVPKQAFGCPRAGMISCLQWEGLGLNIAFNARAHPQSTHVTENSSYLSLSSLWEGHRHLLRSLQAAWHGAALENSRGSHCLSLGFGLRAE